MKSFVRNAHSIPVSSIRRSTVLLAMLWIVSTGASFRLVIGEERYVFTDADTFGVIICRNDAPFPFWCDRSPGREPIIQIQDQNALMSGYWHFDLSEVETSSPIEEARLQFDTTTNAWGETTVSVYAIADSSADWDLNSLPETGLNGINAPFSDYESFAWTGAVPPQQRFNPPTPFLQEGTQADSAVRLLEAGIWQENQDDNTTEEGNAYGGHTNGKAAGSVGSAGGRNNPWPVKNAVDINITDLINWKLGLNPSYSDFDPGDRELTIMIRTDQQESGDPNGFVEFLSKESRFIGPNIGDLNLQPGRIMITGIGNTCDLNEDGTVDASDIDFLFANLGPENSSFDLNTDGVVNQLDVDVLVKDKLNTFYGDANLDGELNSGDFVQVFQEGKYEVDVDAGWAQGDWTGDKRFDSGDFVVAFQDGGFEMGPRVAVNTVPEPSSILLSVLGGLLLCRLRRLNIAFDK